MEKNIKIKILDDKLGIYGKTILEILLKDRTTGKNIIWATNDYIELGKIYSAKNEISLNMISGSNEKFIRPRVTKSYEKQNSRVKGKAEVFTPSWLCNQQNNLIDSQWFDRKDVFNVEQEKSWITIDEKIIFPKIKDRDWKNYVDARRMEITCGEAPYLVSRYDTVTGKLINLKSRIGLLDRKLRIVNENTITEKEWLKWSQRAFESIYGFEYQGDNLLLARENLLFTFIDNIKYKFRREPTLKELKKIATIISWNIWQMDGLTYTVPLSENIDDYIQTSLFDNLEIKVEPKYCKIKNWRSNKIIEYRHIMEGRHHG